MRLWVQACGTAAVIGIAVGAGCGGSVIVDDPGGAGGTGGAGGSPTAITVTGTSAITTGPTTSTAISVTTGTTSVTSVTSSSTGPTPVCDGTGDCGNDQSGCIACAIDPDGGPCGASYETCLSNQQCLDYSNCLGNCDGNDPSCFQKCAESFPMGAQLYNDLVTCVICDACSNDCDGQASGCP